MNLNRWRGFAALAALVPMLVGAEAPKHPQPTRAQTEDWLKQHIESWNETPISVTVRDCRILVTDRQRQRTDIVDLRGLLLPIEIIRDSAHPRDATFRLRVKEKASGTFAMYRICSSENRFCQDPTGKFQVQPWVDLVITKVDDFVPSRDVTVDKANRLQDALEYYSNLCGASEDARNLLF